MIPFAQEHPELVPEWAEPNGGPTPWDVSHGSNRKIHWRGRCGHEWDASVKNRGYNGSGCPYCTGNKVLAGFNDLATVQPGLVPEWSERNHPLTPSQVTAKSNRPVWWVCGKCGQEWRARVSDRTDGHGCPVCAGDRLVSGINDLATGNPELASEWSDRNIKKPTRTWTKSRENVWWVCGKCGHEWTAVVYSRVRGAGCPNCRKLEKRRRHASLPSPQQIMTHYARESGEPLAENDDGAIGIPLQLYIPTLKTAIEYCGTYGHGGRNRGYENAKNWLCLNAGIRLIRILAPDMGEFDNCVCITMTARTYTVLEEALTFAFRMGGITADINLERDFPELCGIMEYELPDRRSRRGMEVTWSQQGT